MGIVVVVVVLMWWCLDDQAPGVLCLVCPHEVR